MCGHRLGSDQYNGCPDPGVLRARRVGWSGLLIHSGCQLGQYTLSSAAHGPRSRLASLAVRQWACDAEAAPTRNSRLVPREARTAAIGLIGTSWTKSASRRFACLRGCCAIGVVVGDEGLARAARRRCPVQGLRQLHRGPSGPIGAAISPLRLFPAARPGANLY
jgi:hypothetical protein